MNVYPVVHIFDWPLFLSMALSLALLWLALARHRLALANRNIGQALSHVHDGTLIFDVSGRAVFVSEVATGILELPSDGLYIDRIKAQFECFRHDGSPLPFPDWPVSRALRGDFVKDERLFFRNHANGVLVTTKITTSPISDRRGRLTHVVVAHDYTDQHRSEEELARVNAIVQGSGDSIISRDLQGRITYWNNAAAQTYGYSAGEMLGNTIDAIVVPGLLDKEREIFASVLRDRTAHRYPAERCTRDGHIIQVDIAVSPILDASGELVGVSNISRDFTGAAEIEAQRRQAQKLAAIGQLTSGIAHDFNNLLGIMLGNLEMLEHDALSNVATREEGLTKRESIRKRILTAHHAGSQAADLTKRLLAFSAQQDLKPAPVTASEAIQNTIHMASRAIGPGISITTALEPSLAAILADRNGLENALLNLALNARDAMPNGGTLHIATQLVQFDADLAAIEAHILPPGRYACISVSDTGTGMSREVIDRAFEPFFTTKPPGQGTGLGLAMVYGFAKQSNGAVRIYSEVNAGTTVSLYLRFAGIPPPPLPSIDVISIQAAAERSGYILLVDDEADLLEIAAAYLTRLGYQTLQARDGPSALDVLAANPHIDLIITDILMPGGMTGFELVHRIRQLNPRAHCMYTSGFPAGTLADRPYRLKECAMLQKPYRLAELAAAVGKILVDTAAPNRAD